MDETTIAVLAIGTFGTVYGLLALWQAKASQKNIARLRAEEERLVRTGG